MSKILGLGLLAFGAYMWWKGSQVDPNALPPGMVRYNPFPGTQSLGIGAYYQQCLKRNYKPSNYQGTVAQWCKQMQMERF